MLAGGIAVTLVGLVGLSVRTNPAVVLLAGLAFGAGFGAVQTAAYLAMTARGGSGDRNAVSALWNSGIDLGASLGGSLLGVAAARYGYATAIWAVPAVVLVGLPIILLPPRRRPEPGAAGESLAYRVIER